MADCDTDDVDYGRAGHGRGDFGSEAVYDMTRPVPRGNNYGRAGGRGAGATYALGGDSDDRVYETATDVRVVEDNDTAEASTDDDIIRPTYGRANGAGSRKQLMYETASGVGSLATYETAEASTDDDVITPTAYDGASGKPTTLTYETAGAKPLANYEVAEASTDDDDVIKPTAYEGTGAAPDRLVYETAGGAPLATYEVAQKHAEDSVIKPTAYEGSGAEPTTYATAGGMPLATYEVAQMHTDANVIKPTAYEGTGAGAEPTTYETAGGMPLATYEVAQDAGDDSDEPNAMASRRKASITSADIAAIAEDFAEMEQDMRGASLPEMEDDDDALPEAPPADYVEMSEDTLPRSGAVLTGQRSDVEDDDAGAEGHTDDYFDMNEGHASSRKPSRTSSYEDAVSSPWEGDDASNADSDLEGLPIEPDDSTADSQPDPYLATD